MPRQTLLRYTEVEALVSTGSLQCPLENEGLKRVEAQAGGEPVSQVSSGSV